MSFGVIGVIPLLVVRRMIKRLEAMERTPDPVAVPGGGSSGLSHPADGAPKAATTMFNAVAFMSSPFASVALTL